MASELQASLRVQDRLTWEAEEAEERALALAAQADATSAEAAELARALEAQYFVRQSLEAKVPLGPQLRARLAEDLARSEAQERAAAEELASEERATAALRAELALLQRASDARALAAERSDRALWKRRARLLRRALRGLAALRGGAARRLLRVDVFACCRSQAALARAFGEWRGRRRDRILAARLGSCVLAPSRRSGDDGGVVVLCPLGVAARVLRAWARARREAERAGGAGLCRLRRLFAGWRRAAAALQELGFRRHWALARADRGLSLRALRGWLACRDRAKELGSRSRTLRWTLRRLALSRTLRVLECRGRWQRLIARRWCCMLRELLLRAAARKLLAAWRWLARRRGRRRRDLEAHWLSRQAQNTLH